MGATGLYKIVGTYAKQIGLKLLPHQFRHSSITAALDATGGNLRKVQRVSRHAKLETKLFGFFSAAYLQAQAALARTKHSAEGKSGEKKRNDG